ncbi:hypothetical protein GCM10009872_12300 [Actinopolymorpha rutila]
MILLYRFHNPMVGEEGLGSDPLHSVGVGPPAEQQQTVRLTRMFDNQAMLKRGARVRSTVR